MRMNAATILLMLLGIFDNGHMIVKASPTSSISHSSTGAISIFQVNVAESSLTSKKKLRDIVAEVKGLQAEFDSPMIKMLHHEVNSLHASGGTSILLGQTFTTSCSFARSSVSAGSKAVKVHSCELFKPNQEVLLHQTQAKLSRSGRFERVRVKKCSNHVLQFDAPLKNAYLSGSFGGSSPRVTQVVPVYSFASLVVCDKARLQPPAWNGKCGGILAIKTDDITVCKNSVISATGRGFRGAPQYVSGNDFVNGYVGESELIGYKVTRQPAGIGSGGGSGNGDGGGYGGAHATRGSAPTNGGCTRATPKPPANLLKDDKRHLFFGGSGGASGSHHKRTRAPIRKGAPGGQSGGILYIETTGQLHIQGKGGIAAEGMKGGDGYFTGARQYMGGGGGGAGGTVYIHNPRKKAQNQRDANQILVNGGAGGRGFVGGNCGRSGKGGSGGKGRVLID